MTELERILLVAPALSGGGAEYQWRVLAKALRRLGHDVRIATLTDSSDVHEGELTELGIPRDVLATGFSAARGNRVARAAALVRATDRLRKLIESTRPHVVYSCLTITNLIARAAAFGTGARLVWGIRGLREPFPYFPEALSLLERRVSVGVPLIIVNSEATRRFHERRGLRPKRWAVVHNGFDADRFRPRADVGLQVRRALGLDPADFVVGCVARFTPEKDHGTLLRALRFVHESHADTQVVLVGVGSRQVTARIRACARAFGLADRLRMVEAHEGVEDHYSAFDVHVLASWSESFPNAIGEAMASGCAVVGTDVGGVGELVGDAGIVVPPRDDRALARAINELAANPLRRVALGQAGRERVIGRFSVDRMAELTRRAWRDAR